MYQLRSRGIQVDSIRTDEAAGLSMRSFLAVILPGPDFACPICQLSPWDTTLSTAYCGTCKVVGRALLFTDVGQGTRHAQPPIRDRPKAFGPTINQDSRDRQAGGRDGDIYPASMYRGRVAASALATPVVNFHSLQHLHPRPRVAPLSPFRQPHGLPHTARTK